MCQPGKQNKSYKNTLGKYSMLLWILYVFVEKGSMSQFGLIKFCEKPRFYVLND